MFLGELASVVVTNPFEKMDLVAPITELGGYLVEAVGPLVVPILGVSLSIAAIPMGISLVKKLAKRVA